MSTQEMKQFFNLLDNYLIEDLNVMINEIQPRCSGGLGYPSIQTILAGMELLGFVLSGGKKDEKAFDHFWSNFFVIHNPQYNNEGLRKIFRYSIRNGTAHYFLTKAGIRLSKENRNNLTRTTSDELNIDIKTLYGDFKNTYTKIKDELLLNKDSELINNFKTGYKRLFKDLTASKAEVDKYIQDIPELKAECEYSKEYTTTSSVTSYASSILMPVSGKDTTLPP